MGNGSQFYRLTIGTRMCGVERGVSPFLPITKKHLPAGRPFDARLSRQHGLSPVSWNCDNDSLVVYQNCPDRFSAILAIEMNLNGSMDGHHSPFNSRREFALGKGKYLFLPGRRRSRSCPSKLVGGIRIDWRDSFTRALSGGGLLELEDVGRQFILGIAVNFCMSSGSAAN